MLTLNSESRHHKVFSAVTRVVCAVRESRRSVLVRVYVCQCLYISFSVEMKALKKSCFFDCVHA